MIERRIGLTVVLGAAAAVAMAQQGASKPAGHVMVSPAELTWGDPPPALPKGARVAVLSGDPTQSGPFTIRAKFPPGYKVMPHWHPTAEHLTVIEGTFSVGQGEKFDTKAVHDMPAGGFSVMPAEMRHFAYTKDGATIQVHGNGPFTLTYVNAADDPRTAAPVANQP